MKQTGSFLLKYRADRLQVLVIGLSVVNLATHWFAPSIHWWQVAVSLLLAAPLAATIHNIHHDPMWKFKPLNILTEYWASCFYPLPMSAWVAVHNQSHHRYHNSPEGDVTSTHFGGDKPTVSSLLLDIMRAVPGFYAASFKFLGDQWRHSRAKFFYQISHWVLLYGGLTLLLIVDWRKTLLLIVLPQQTSLIILTVFNYVQHVDTRHDITMETSRNFTGKWLNFYTLNSGYHIVHHLKPRMHWSLTKSEYFRVVPQVPQHLIEKSFIGYVFRNFVLGMNKMNGLKKEKAA